MRLELGKVSWRAGFMTGFKGYSEGQYKFKEMEKLWVGFSPISLKVEERTVVGRRCGWSHSAGILRSGFKAYIPYM